MHNHSKISVVCPTFNSASYITETLESLLYQASAPYEIIFSDDGSTDETVSIIEAFKPKFDKKNIKVTILKNTHQGPGAARNAAINSAMGDWVSFLDADDQWSSEKIATVKDRINSTDSNFFIHWEQYKRLDGTIRVLNHCVNYDFSISLQKQLYQSCLFSTSAVTVKRSLLIKVGLFNITLPSSQDYELWLRLSPYIRLCIIPKVLGFYIETATSITSRPYYKRIWPMVRVYWMHRNKVNFLKFSYQVMRLFITKNWYGVFRNIILNRVSH